MAEMDMIDRLISREGGAKITNAPDDAGGLTKFGISQKSNPGVDIAKLDYAGARELYKAKYLHDPLIYLLPDSIQEQVFDFGVHSGPKKAIIQLQRLLGINQDGIIGQQTLAALKALPTLQMANLVRVYNRERINYMIRQVEETPSKLKFLRGWVMRVLNL